MQRITKSLLPLILPGLALLALTACPQKEAADQRDLIAVGDEAPAQEDPALVERRQIEFDAEQLEPGEPAEVVLPLPEETVRVKVDPVPAEVLGLTSEQSAWVGYTEDGSELFIMRLGRSYEAQFSGPRLIYRIRSVDGVKGTLEIYDAQRFREAPNDGVRGPESPTRGPSGDAACTDPASRIDIMVFYTPEARNGSGGVADIENEIAFAVGRTNLAYANSDASHRLNLVSVDLANFNEPADGVDSNALLGDLQNTADGVLDTVHGTRDSVKADLVSLIYEVDDSTWCGWGNTVENANADTTDHRAFSVVKRSCASSNLSFPHEVGHNLGALHDRDNAGASSLGYNFGHIEPDPTSALSPWRTVMSYSDPCGDQSDTGFCQRVAWFSNPDVDRSGDATGVPLADDEPEHNVNAFAQNDGHVTRYRCLRKDIDTADVWMKDRWEDTGGEPDPATAGKAMWQSPYIWVRRSEDATLEHEHEHQDPQLGIENHVYVKIHNDGTVEDPGDLELYFAAASTNLNDPANWTQIGTRNETLSPGVEVFNFTWDDLPGEGHYCLLARWNTDGSALAFMDLGTAVRNDNDLIWRNVNIVDLGGDIDDSAGDFMMAGHREFRDTFLVLEIGPKNEPRLDWPNLVKVTMKIDPEALAYDQLSVQGLEPIGQGLYQVPITAVGTNAVIGSFRLSPQQSTQIALDFEVDREALRKAQGTLANPEYYDITASQISPGAATTAAVDASTTVLGGVTFTLMVPAEE